MKQTTTLATPLPGGGAGFWALVATQFQGAFSDNLFKMLVILSLPAMVGSAEYPVTALAFLLFNIPFLLVPGFSGALADRLSKKTVTVITKYMELGVMSLGLVSFMVQSAPLALATLFLMATQSALFSPAKYGILPEILPAGRLSWGNGIIQLTTFIAIIAGTAVAGPLLESLGGELYHVMFAVLGCTCIGLTASHFITKPPAGDPERALTLNPWDGLGTALKRFRQDRHRMLTMLGIAFFWFAGVLVSQAIIELGKAITDSPTRQSLMPAALALGIGAGSAVAGFLSRGRIELGLIPVGGVGLAVLCFAIGLGTWGYGVTIALVLALGVFAGIFNLPLAVTLQQRSPKESKGGMIAASNFVNFFGMSIASVAVLGLFNVAGLPASAVFAITGVLTAAVTVYALWLLRYEVIRFAAACFLRVFYRVKTANDFEVPQTGGALLVANHVSFIDALLLATATERRVRFLAFKGIYDKWYVKPIAAAAGAIPVLPKSDPAHIEHALSLATEAIQRGEVVAIFAEGGITRTGELMPFKRGLERIMAKTEGAPIVPVYLDGLWGSVFSFAGGKFFWKTPKAIPYRVGVTFGAPLPGDSRAETVREAIVDLAKTTGTSGACLGAAPTNSLAA